MPDNDALRVSQPEQFYHVDWLEEEQEWVATHSQFPSLSWLDKDKNVALAELKVLVTECEADIATEEV